MINVNTFKHGTTFLDDNQIFMVLDAQHSKQGRGQANVKVKVKNLRTGSITIKSFTGGDKVKPAYIEKIKMCYLYKDNDFIYLMNNTTYEQINIEINKVKWEINFLLENSNIEVRVFEKEILDLELPKNIPIKVITAPDGTKGNSQSTPSKKVILETGFELEVPIFIKENDIIIVSSETGKYVSRY